MTLLEVDLKKANKRWSTALKDAQQHLLKYNELEESTLCIREEAKSTKEKEMREETFSNEISKAFTNFRLVT